MRGRSNKACVWCNLPINRTDTKEIYRNSHALCHRLGYATPMRKRYELKEQAQKRKVEARKAEKIAEETLPVRWDTEENNEEVASHNAIIETTLDDRAIIVQINRHLALCKRSKVVDPPFLVREHYDRIKDPRLDLLMVLASPIDLDRSLDGSGRTIEHTWSIDDERSCALLKDKEALAQRPSISLLKAILYFFSGSYTTDEPPGIFSIRRRPRGRPKGGDDWLYEPHRTADLPVNPSKCKRCGISVEFDNYYLTHMWERLGICPYCFNYLRAARKHRKFARCRPAVRSIGINGLAILFLGDNTVFCKRCHRFFLVHNAGAMDAPRVALEYCFVGDQPIGVNMLNTTSEIDGSFVCCACLKEEYDFFVRKCCVCGIRLKIDRSLPPPMHPICPECLKNPGKIATAEYVKCSDCNRITPSNVRHNKEHHGWRTLFYREVVSADGHWEVFNSGQKTVLCPRCFAAKFKGLDYDMAAIPRCTWCGAQLDWGKSDELYFGLHFCSERCVRDHKKRCVSECHKCGGLFLTKDPIPNGEPLVINFYRFHSRAFPGFDILSRSKFCPACRYWKGRRHEFSPPEMKKFSFNPQTFKQEVSNVLRS